ncbi:hypothetical protein [Candidatus Laterigemmans baculatus]|uniref:hypothetical protein n=1 Tax=Candidatus Laterigemmans baculatus TaxID=2770505 RepID=UPI0013DAA405|nr:hypothetical protein [Candidatus Laterigemmans baculatus]
MAAAERTTDHDTIRQWVEARKAVPATVKGTAEGDEEAGLLRIDFPDATPDPNLEPISWEDFFEKFEESRLAFLYQEKTDDGSLSRFCKFVSREE